VVSRAKLELDNGAGSNSRSAVLIITISIEVDRLDGVTRCELKGVVSDPGVINFISFSFYSTGIGEEVLSGGSVGLEGGGGGDEGGEYGKLHDGWMDGCGCAIWDFMA